MNVDYKDNELIYDKNYEINGEIFNLVKELVKRNYEKFDSFKYKLKDNQIIIFNGGYLNMLCKIYIINSSDQKKICFELLCHCCNQIRNYYLL